MLQGLLVENEELFKPGLGTLKGVEVSIDIDQNASPKFVEARPVPFAMKPKVEAELERLEREGIIEPVQFSQWAAPIVPVMKPDGSIRICGDYKVTVNQASRADTYPIPRIDELFTKLAGGECFTKLDLSHAYQHLVMPRDRGISSASTHIAACFAIHGCPFV